MNQPLKNTDSVSIEVNSVSKSYPILASASQRYAYLMSNIFDAQKYKDRVVTFPALKDITFEVIRGERVGIIGRNGAGKSTLLKIIGGDFAPTVGDCRVHGERHNLLPNSMGFEQQMSARENAEQYFQTNGISGKDLEARISDVEEFVELGPYFDQPFRNYSLGMQVRCLFATATAIVSDIVIIDEVLGAGDIYWAEKCAQRMDKLCATGSTLLLVSHSLDQVQRFCERCIWIERGEMLMDGPTSSIVHKYESFLEKLAWQTDDVDDKSAEIEEIAPNLGLEPLPETGQDVTRWPGLKDVQISGVWFDDEPTSTLTISDGSKKPSSSKISFSLKSQSKRKLRLRYLITFWSQKGKRFAVVENDYHPISAKSGDHWTVNCDVDLSGLPAGDYNMSISIFDLQVQKSSADEMSTRVDMLWKSFSVVRQSNQPMSDLISINI